MITLGGLPAAEKARALAHYAAIAKQAQQGLTMAYFHSDTIGAVVVAGLEVEDTERHALFGSTGNSYLVTLTLEGVDIAPHLSQCAVDVILSEALASLRRKS